MTNYREILRLSCLGLNKAQIAGACGCSRTTVIKVLNIAAAQGLSYPLPDGMSDKQLADTLFPANAAKPEYKMPDYEYIKACILSVLAVNYDTTIKTEILVYSWMIDY